MATKRAGKGDKNGEVGGVEEMNGSKPSEHDAKRSKLSANSVGTHPNNLSLRTIVSSRRIPRPRYLSSSLSAHPTTVAIESSGNLIEWHNIQPHRKIVETKPYHACTLWNNKVPFVPLDLQFFNIKQSSPNTFDFVYQ